MPRELRDVLSRWRYVEHALERGAGDRAILEQERRRLRDQVRELYVEKLGRPPVPTPTVDQEATDASSVAADPR